MPHSHCQIQAVIDAIELDPEVVKVATQWFALPTRDSRMNVQVVDALDYLEEAAQKSRFTVCGEKTLL